MARSSTPRSTRRSTTSSRSTRRSVTGTRTRTSAPRTVKRSLKHFTFTYNRDDVSHAANANGIVIAERGNTGTTVSLSLQEAKSLYDFLSSQIRTR